MLVWALSQCQPDRYFAIRGTFSVPTAGELEVQTVGSSWFQGWMDGEWLLEGPQRFPKGRPEYDSVLAAVDSGPHTLAFALHHIGIHTRILLDTPPFLWCRLLLDGEEIHAAWKAMPLEAFRPTGRRINPQLGWMEWCDLRKLPSHWQETSFDDSAWEPAPLEDPFELKAERQKPSGSALSTCSPYVLPSAWEAPRASRIATVRQFRHPLEPVASGPLASTFGYIYDDPPVGFYLRDLDPEGLPVRGFWLRYDLGRVRLGRFGLRLRAPAGTLVEVAMAESLTDGRVAPWINLSAGASCALDRFETREGEQFLRTITPKGGRFVEVHILRPEAVVEILGAEFIERCYHEPTGQDRGQGLNLE